MLNDDSNGRLVREILLVALEGGNYDTGPAGEKLHNDSHFIKEIGIDSLDLLDFYLRLEDQFKVEIRDADYPSLTSVQAVTEFLKEKDGALSK